MRLSTLVMILALFAIVGCGNSGTTPATLTPEQEAKQKADAKEVDDAENAMQKESGGIQSKPKKR